MMTAAEKAEAAKGVATLVVVAKRVATLFVVK
jgi:hypothetical protein